MPGPLDGLQVLDLSRDVAGPYATKLLADYGARVIKVEPRGGDPARAFGPFPDGKPDPEASGLFLHLNTSKQSVVLDAHTDDGAATVRRLASQVHVVVEDLAPGEAARYGWGWDQLRAINPSLILCSITPFGQEGPYAPYRGSELALQAIGGPLHATGNAAREPLKLAGHYAAYHAGATAALAILLALRRSESASAPSRAQAAGDWLDISIYRCQAGCRDRRTIQLTSAAYSGINPGRAVKGGRRVGFGIYPCADGHVNIMGAGTRLPRLLKWIGAKSLLDQLDDDGLPPGGPEFGDQVDQAVEDFLADIAKLDAVARAQDAGLLAGAVMTVPDIFQDPQLLARDWWHEITHWHGAPLRYPGLPFRFSDSESDPPKRAPRLGEHARVVLDFAPPDADERAPAPEPDPAPPDLPLPLQGIRVAAVTVVWAGPHVAQLLAEWGADVVNVEPVNRIQPYTRGAESAPTTAQIHRYAERGIQPQYPDSDPGADPWNRFASFNSHARNKRSMTCDIMSPEGREAFLKLIEHCDVLVENNVPTTIDKAGIAYDQLREINPRLIMLRMPAFGLQGPYSGFRAFGLHVEAMVGHTHLRGYPDMGPDEIGETLASDGISGVQGAVAVLMALRHRERTGQGQMIEMPLNEGFIPTLAEFLFDHAMNAANPPPQANSHRHHAPHNVYPAQGDDQWIAIDVDGDQEFSALCDALAAQASHDGRDSDIAHLPHDPRFHSTETRRQFLPELDELIAAETRHWNKTELFHALQAAGICAAPVNSATDALEDPHLNQTGFFQHLEIDGVGSHKYPGLTIQMRRTPNYIRTPPPTLGQHNDEIYQDLLGYTPRQQAELEARGIVGTRYPPRLLPKHIRDLQPSDQP